MSDSNNKIVSCLCGDVKIEASEINPKFTVCHCETCRTWGGGPLFAVECGTDVKFEGIESIKEYKSSPWATRGFCHNCGTHLFYRLNNTGSYNMPIGLFPHLKKPVMTMQYFSDQRPDYYCFSNETKEITKAEIEAYFSSLN